ncbi:MAG: SpoIIIAH-like family protein [Clostridia bacterium]|nr:SpoIIIAH-like family protein [Clostridia bacterium]
MFIAVKIKKAFLVLLCSISVIFVLVLNIVKIPDNLSTKKELLNENTSEKELMPGEAVAVSTQDDGILVAKNNREFARSKTAELLRNIIDDKNITSDARKKAEDSIINLAGQIEKEQKIESLLLSKGYKECVAYVSEESTMLTIRKDKLEIKDMAKINDIIYEITGNNIIKIVEVK